MEKLRIIVAGEYKQEIMNWLIERGEPNDIYVFMYLANAPKETKEKQDKYLHELFNGNIDYLVSFGRLVGSGLVESCYSWNEGIIVHWDKTIEMLNDCF